MEQFTIDIKKRGETGSRAASRLRRSGLIPSIVFHRGDASIPTVLNEKEFIRTAKLCGPSQVFIFKSDESGLNGKSAIVREIKKDYVKNRILHVDFQALKDDEAITINVTVEFIGEAQGVKIEGGVLSVALHEIEISCVPKLIPSKITVDVSALSIGDKITLGDLKLGEGISLSGAVEEVIVSVIHAMKEEEVKPAADAAAVTAEGAAAPGAAAGADAAPAAAAAKGKEDKK